jgi:hypothetical protein
MVDWIDYYKSAVKHGMQSDRVLLRLENDISDVYGPMYKEEIITRLKFYIQGIS